MKYKYAIAVSGAAQIGHCCKNIKELAKEVGREIAHKGCILVTGATTGVPYFSSVGNQEVKGFSIGFSPATSEAAHLKTYKLPIDSFDLMIYTGADYVGRDVIMTKSVDGVIIICGRMGTLHEFTTAFEAKKPIAVLEGSGGTADQIRMITAGPIRGTRKIIYSKDPKKIVGELIEAIKKEKKENQSIPLGKS